MFKNGLGGTYQTLINIKNVAYPNGGSLPKSGGGWISVLQPILRPGDRKLVISCREKIPPSRNSPLTYLFVNAFTNVPTTSKRSHRELVVC